VLNKPLKVGLSARILHTAPRELGLRGKTLQYLEQTVAHWLMTAGVLVFMVPSIAGGGLLRRGNVRIADYADELDALVLQGGADVSPLTYGESPARPEWAGDRVRDLYEIDLVQEFISRGKPVLGICRGLQLINVAFGGTLYQDIQAEHANGLEHYDADAYDQHTHPISIVAGTRLAELYPGTGEARVNSIHHQAVEKVGSGLVVEALSVPDRVVEAIRSTGPGYVVGVQWHPEFHDPENTQLLDGGPLLQDFLEHAGRSRTGAPRKPPAEPAPSSA